VVAAAALLACPALGYFPTVFERLLTPLSWFNDSEYFLAFPLVLSGVGLVSTVWLKRQQEARKLRSAVMVAFQIHDFQRVLKIGRSDPKVVARDPLLHYHIAFARAICGDRRAAIEELQFLWHKHPGLPITAFTLSSLLLDADEAEQALAVAQIVARRLPNDPLTHVLVARSLRRLGRLEESREACQRALALEPRHGNAHAVAAAIEVDEGNFLQAQRSIARALELAPGEPYVLLVRAETVLKTQPYGDPRVAVEEALAVIRANPLAFYHADVRRLEQALGECERTLPVLETAAV
jgi:tetratricopeptide (TPR) repeat protein